MESRTVTARTAPSGELGKNATAQATTTVGVKCYIIIEKSIKYKKKTHTHTHTTETGTSSSAGTIQLHSTSAMKNPQHLGVFFRTVTKTVAPQNKRS